MTKKEQVSLLYDYLKSLAPISETIFNELILLFESSSYKSGDYIIKQGQDVKDIFFITKGLVRSYYLTNLGKERNKSFYGRKSVVSSHYALSTNQNSNLNISCIEDTSVLKVNFNKMRELNDKDLNLQICARKIAEIEFMSKDKREFQFLTMDSKERYIAFLKDFPQIASRIPDNQIASYLGIRKETLSRIKKEI